MKEKKVKHLVTRRITYIAQ